RELVTMILPDRCFWICWRPDGHVLAATTRSGSLHIFDTATGTELRKPLKINALYFQSAPQGDRVLAFDGMLWDVHGRRPLLALPGELYSEPSPTFPGGWVTRSGSKLCFWRLHAGDEFRTLVRSWAPPGEQITRLVPDRSGRLLATQCGPGAKFAF